ncbi:MAG: hypothetical protein J6R82_02450 [Clostridia bacterium]|nr:hypothetical protein [Clostridia bacterium]
MKHTKRILLSLLAGLLALTVLTACDTEGAYIPDEDEDDAPKVTTTATTTTTAPQTDDDKDPEVHTHTAVEGWLVDRVNHWQLCACGEIIEKAAHTVEDEVCTGCKAQVTTLNDGTVFVYQFDEHENALLCLTYDSDGKIMCKQIGEFTYHEHGWLLSELYTIYDYDADSTSTTKEDYTYDEKGNRLTEKQYEDGKLTYECEFALDADGEEYTSKDIWYEEDGSKVVTEYDEEYNVLSEVWYDANGNRIDYSYLFDPEACKDLFGTWSGEIDLSEMIYDQMMDEDMALPDGFDYPCNAVFTFVFKNDGTCHAQMTVDPQQVKTMMIELAVEFVYLSAEEQGMNRKQADEAFVAMMGMNVREYVETSFAENEEDLSAELNESHDGVYYVADGKIYMGDSWHQPMEDGGDFTLEGDTLKLIDPELEMELTLTRVVE